MKKHFYILATPASGKTTFLKNNGKQHGNLIVYDLDKVKKETSAQYRTYKAFEQLPENTAILGGRTSGTIKYNPEKCIYVAVIIPEQELFRNVELRSKDKKAKKNKWRKKENVIKAYNELKQFVEKENIPCFSSFQEAIDYINYTYYESSNSTRS